MSRFIPSVLLSLLLCTPAPAQTIVGDRPAKAEVVAATQTLAKLEAKKITLDQGEFEELVPKKGSTSPFLWISSNNDIVTTYEIEKGQSFAIVGKRRGSNGTPYDFHSFPPREFRWAIAVANKQPEPLFTKDGKPVPLKTTLHIIKNGDNGSAEEADLVEITLGKQVAPIPPVKPDEPVKPDVKPDVKPAIDAELVAKFKASLAADKAAAATQGYDWSKAAVWAGTYQDTAMILKSGDPALAVKDVADLYAKHKATWLVQKVPPKPFLTQTRGVIETLLDAGLGEVPGAPVARMEASKLFERIGNALTEALKP
jgi:hypothetical protein